MIGFFQFAVRFGHVRLLQNSAVARGETLVSRYHRSDKLLRIPGIEAERQVLWRGLCCHGSLRHVVILSLPGHGTAGRVGLVEAAEQEHAS